VDEHLALRDVADEALAGLGEAHHGRRHPAALFVDDDARVGVVHVRADRVGGSQIDPDDLAHESPDSRRRENVAVVECRTRGPAGEGTKKSRRRGGVPGAGVEPALPWGKRLLRPPCLTNSTTRAASSSYQQATAAGC